MPSFGYVVELLRAAQRDPRRLGPALAAAEELEFNDEAEYQSLAEPVQAALDDLTLDLDYYEPDPTVRSQHSVYFGPDELIARVERFLSRIDEATP
ncbi:MAG: hypothetical protein ABJF88_11535 [Rhodothermales bacterium]